MSDVISTYATRVRHAVTAAALVLFIGATAAAASATTGFDALPIGKNVTYHITVSMQRPELAGGSSSTDEYVKIARPSIQEFDITVNGQPAGSIFLDVNGNPSIPASLQQPMAPFLEIGLLTRGAPTPLTPNASWAAQLPVPLGDGNSDNVAVVANVTQFAPQGNAMQASGQNMTEVQPGIRRDPTDVSYTAQMRFTPDHVIGFASSSLSVVVHQGRFRTKHIAQNWTLSLAN
jgi:hypothetical protein